MSEHCFECIFLQSLRSLLGEELSDFLASGERERRLENIRARIRLLRDLRPDTRAKGMRTMSDQPSARKHKPGTKKTTNTAKSGCFGHKMDRIGTISGMGCGPWVAWQFIGKPIFIKERKDASLVVANAWLDEVNCSLSSKLDNSHTLLIQALVCVRTNTDQIFNRKNQSHLVIAMTFMFRCYI